MVPGCGGEAERGDGNKGRAVLKSGNTGCAEIGGVAIFWASEARKLGVGRDKISIFCGRAARELRAPPPPAPADLSLEMAVKLRQKLPRRVSGLGGISSLELLEVVDLGLLGSL